MDIMLLDLAGTDSGYVIYKGDSPLLTKEGNILAHPEQRLLKHIITDIELNGPDPTPKITVLKLLEFQADYLDQGADMISDDFDLLAGTDEFIQLKAGKKEEISHLSTPETGEWSGLDSSIMNTLFWGASSIIMNLNKFIAGNIQQIEPEDTAEHPFIMLLRQQYLDLEPEQRSAMHLLCYMHRAAIVLPLLLVLDRITASEYAKGVLSIWRKSIPSMKDPAYEWRKDFPYPPMVITGEHPLSIYHHCLTDSYAVVDYLSYSRVSGESKITVRELQKRGEGSELEYKSTLRWDIKAGKTNNAIERACLKTITGFLNSSGGILLIGVRDDGSVEGIESDRFTNEDNFLLHLWTLIRTSLGRDVSPYIRTLLEKTGEKTVCIVKCNKSPQPVFLRQPGFSEEFYIRVGPSSNALDISEALRYITLNY